MRSLYLEQAALPSRSQQLPNTEVPPRSHSSSRYFHPQPQTFYKSLPLHEQMFAGSKSNRMRNEELFPYEAEITSHTEIYHAEETHYLLLGRHAAPGLLLLHQKGYGRSCQVQRHLAQSDGV